MAGREFVAVSALKPPGTVVAKVDGKPIDVAMIESSRWLCTADR